jgi:hypothetical protein
LWTLRERLGETDPRQLRPVLREVVSRADVFFTSRPQRSDRVRPDFDYRARIRPDRQLNSFASTGLPMESLAGKLAVLAGG